MNIQSSLEAMSIHGLPAHTGNVRTFDHGAADGSTPHEDKFVDRRNAVLRSIPRLCDL